MGLAIRTIALAHSDPRKVSLARELDARYPTRPDGPSGSAWVIRRGESTLAPELRIADAVGWKPTRTLDAIIDETIAYHRGLGVTA